MTDKEKFINLFNEIGVIYKESNRVLIIDEKCFSPGNFFPEGVEIHFNSDGKFAYFEGWGE